jgi:hypothetical protein
VVTRRATGRLLSPNDKTPEQIIQDQTNTILHCQQ